MSELLDDLLEERRKNALEYKESIPDLIAKWEPVIGVSVPRWSIRRMKTKWGSCNR